jgi:hypothetical protein
MRRGSLIQAICLGSQPKWRQDKRLFRTGPGHMTGQTSSLEVRDKKNAESSGLRTETKRNRWQRLTETHRSRYVKFLFAVFFSGWV